MTGRMSRRRSVSSIDRNKKTRVSRIQVAVVLIVIKIHGVIHVVSNERHVVMMVLLRIIGGNEKTTVTSFKIMEVEIDVVVSASIIESLIVYLLNIITIPWHDC
jgi:hypothetical protein